MRLMTRNNFRIPLTRAAAIVAALASFSAAPAKSTVTGVITDAMCAASGHAAMRMGPTDAECTKACVAAHGASYVLLDGKQIYALSDQKLPEKFAGQKVKVVGALDAKTRKITVESI